MAHTGTTVVTDHSFTEGPRWHEGRLWFSDFYLGRVSSVREDGSDLRVEAEVPNQPSGLGWLPDGRLLVVSMRDQQVLRREDDGSLVVHADLSDHVRGHANDMVVDDQGRAYVGCFGFDLMAGAPVELAPLCRVDPDGTVTTVAEDLWFPNGMAIADGVLLVNETVGNRVTAFDVAEDGSLDNRRVWAEFAPVPTDRDFEKALEQVVLAADGAALDSEGGWWVADAVGGRLVRVVEGGEITETIQPGTGVFACALGGSDGTTLFACLAPDFFEHARREATEATIIAFPVSVPAAGAARPAG